MDLLVEVQTSNVTGKGPYLPLKKMSLLIWKLSLCIFGGIHEAHVIKNKKRLTEGLPLIEDPMETISKLIPARVHAYCTSKTRIEL